MPTDEEEKGMVLYEYQQVENEVVSLRSQAVGLGNRIAQFGAWLQNSPERNIYQEGRSAHHGFEIEPVPREVFEAMANWKQCFDVVDKLREARSRLEELRKQKAKLGLR